jgi:cyclohexa-1,5-dienecarbonyl-CoA hydratase
MAYNHIIVEIKDKTGFIILNKEPLNVLNIEMMAEINEALLSFQDNIKLLVFKATGKAFSAGVDVGEHMDGMAEKMIEIFHQMFRNMDKLGVPSIAVVQGAALGGGCELAVYCDMVIASEKAKFGQPEIMVGVFPPIAALLFPRIMGRKKAMELILSGDIISAKECEELGLINKAVPPDALEEEAESFIKKFEKLSGVVMKYTKDAVMTGLLDEQDSALKKIEKLYLDELMKTTDANEGLSAFLNKRKPEWKEC